MRISVISDVHIKTPHDVADKLLVSFLDHSLVQSSDYVLLLGDIFDLMCGQHEEYLTIYSHIFSRLNDFVKNGKKVIFSEGNHDVNLEKLFMKYWPGREVIPVQTPIIEIIDGKKYYFSHGDEHDINNVSYHRYMRFIQSPPLKFVADYVMPYSVLHLLGEKASKISRKKGSRLFDEEKVKVKFRDGVERNAEGKGFDFIIGGHSHVKDMYHLSNGHTLFINNGYALKTKSFVLIEDHNASFVPLA